MNKELRPIMLVFIAILILILILFLKYFVWLLLLLALVGLGRKFLINGLLIALCLWYLGYIPLVTHYVMLFLGKQ